MLEKTQSEMKMQLKNPTRKQVELQILQVE